MSIDTVVVARPCAAQGAVEGFGRDGRRWQILVGPFAAPPPGAAAASGGGADAAPAGAVARPWHRPVPGRLGLLS